MTEHTELYKKMTSLAFKQDISAERVERIGRRIASEQLESAAMLPIKRGGSGRRRLQRIAYWAEWRRLYGWAEPTPDPDEDADDIIVELDGHNDDETDSNGA